MISQYIKSLLLHFGVLILAIFIVGCSSTKHVPQGKYLVNEVKIDIEDNENISSSELTNYLRQTPNHKVLGFLKLQLATYNISGRDSTKWYNKWIRKIGQPPVIFDEKLTDASANQLRQALINKGFLETTVDVDTFINARKKKIDVKYTITTGKPHYIATVDYNIPDTAIANIILRERRATQIKPGDLLDRNVLEEERTNIAEILRNRGYYTFNKQYVTYSADTATNAKDVNLTLNVRPPVIRQGSLPDSTTQPDKHKVYYVRNIIFVTDYNPSTDYGKATFDSRDSIRYKNISVLYGNDHYLEPSALYEANRIVPGKIYTDREVNQTYEALGRLGIIRYTNIEMRQVGNADGKDWLDAYILLTRGKKQGVSLELEGTNSEGDLGFGVGLTYQHRNLAHGSELLTAKFRTSYESLSGDFNGLINNRYMEYAGEVGITFPKFEAPFLSYDLKRRIKASTEFSVSLNYQERPEYTRIIAGAAWKYHWSYRINNIRHRFDLIDINYVYLPKSTLNFLDQIAPSNPLLRYSYEDHFIMRDGYSFYRTNKRIPSGSDYNKKRFQRNIFTIRANAETAGNLLYLISKAIGQKRSDGAYKVFGIQYAQYVKADADYTFTHNFNPRNALAFHAGMGIGVPYGNSSMLPFEKRFYAGGANSVRGWGVRTLGPGSYSSRNSMTDFINQCGDIRLDLSLEYRAKLFWVMEGGLFVDAGNIWTIHNYENQPGGMFKFNRFYEQIAFAYGCGIRLDFTYFLLRLDLGFKAYNPAHGQERWPLTHFKWSRDATFHFSVGYPF
ncbi:MAG: sorting and assembly machinery component 50 [Muribaculum sp.]|nr:sorting and assembly machinery component 50 [Muribaculum sp.]